MPNKRKMVRRFSMQVIVAHWLNAAAYFILALTGASLYSGWFDWVIVLFGGPANTRLVHRIFAVVLMLPILYMLVADPKSFFHWIKQAFTWKKHDLAFFIHFPKEFFGGHSKGMPKQDFFNAGEKLNSLLTMFTLAILTISGTFMWFHDDFPREMVQWAYFFHDFGFGIGGAVIIGHIFLSTGHPGSKIAMEGMTTGKVPIEYAKDHHENWYDELKA